MAAILKFHFLALTRRRFRLSFSNFTRVLHRHHRATGYDSLSPTNNKLEICCWTPSLIVIAQPTFWGLQPQFSCHWLLLYTRLFHLCKLFPKMIILTKICGRGHTISTKALYFPASIFCGEKANFILMEVNIYLDESFKSCQSV